MGEFAAEALGTGIILLTRLAVKLGY